MGTFHLDKTLLSVGELGTVYTGNGAQLEGPCRPLSHMIMSYAMRRSDTLLLGYERCLLLCLRESTCQCGPYWRRFHPQLLHSTWHPSHPHTSLYNASTSFLAYMVFFLLHLRLGNAVYFNDFCLLNVAGRTDQSDFWEGRGRSRTVLFLLLSVCYEFNREPGEIMR